MDNIETIEMIQANEVEQSYSTVGCAIKDLLKCTWMVHVRYVFKEGNKVADGLTKNDVLKTFGKTYLHAITG